MTGSPFIISAPSLTWTPPPSTLTATIGSGTAIGGYGLCGYGLFLSAVASSPATSVIPIPVASALHDGTIGVAYSTTISAQGGQTPYVFAITASALPTGLSMTSLGSVTGTPTTVGTFAFTVSVTDANGFVGSQAFNININAPAASGYSFLG